MDNSKKLEFTKQLEVLLKMAKPSIKSVEFTTGAQYDKLLNCWDKPDYTPRYHPEDELVIVTMGNGYGYDYPVNVTGNSLMGTLSDVVETIKHK